VPPGFDEDHKCQVCFAAEQSKEKKKDCCSTIRNEQTNEDSQSRNGASVSEGHGLSNKDLLFAASFAQKSSFQQTCQSSSFSMNE